MRHQQRGISFLGFIIVLAVVGFFLFLGMRIGPTYLEYFTIRKAMDQVAAETTTVEPAVIREAMRRRMQIDYSANFKPEFVRIQREGNQTNLVLAYEVREPLIYNLDFVASFEHTSPVRQGGAP